MDILSGLKKIIENMEGKVFTNLNKEETNKAIKKYFNKNEFSYLDHFLNKKKNVTIQNTYIFVLANYNDNFDIIKKYTFL